MNVRLLTAAIAIAMSPIVALADGLPSERIAAPAAAPCCEYVPIPDWTGVYIGIHGGAAWTKTDWSFPFDESFNTAAGQSFPVSTSGTILGAHIGLNYQFWRVVVGTEATYTLAGLNNTVTGPFAAAPTDRFKFETKDLYTISGRLGVAFDKFLVYGKGGYAASLVEVSAITPAGILANASQHQSGYIVGGGVDMRLFTDVLFGLEYDYINLGTDRFTSVTTGTTPNLPFNADIGDTRSQIFMARLSILFGPNACCHDGLFGKY